MTPHSSRSAQAGHSSVSARVAVTTAMATTNSESSLSGRLNRFLYGKNAFRYHVVPISFVVVFTVGVQVLMVWAHGKAASTQAVLDNIKGDSTSWAITIVFYVYAWLSIATSYDIHFGPETSFGVRPRYADNGFIFYVMTMIIFFATQFVYPFTSRVIYEKFPKIIGASNTLALVFCAWLYYKGKYQREHAGDIAEPAPAAYEFYRGMELHPKILNVDVKQFTNCRVGMMSWPLFLTAFYIHSLHLYGYNAANFMHFVLQMVYITKFFWWENGYFHTLDMMVDRAGYYLCWGCLVFLPAYFCFPAALVITEPNNLPDYAAYLIGGVGLLLTALEYSIDHQKQGFRAAWPEPYTIWGKPATFILAEYTDSQGIRKQSPLLTCGFWGLARHLNYAVEIIISFTISATLGFNHGIYTFAYFILIAPLVLHRILRDDAKCSAKYGKDWQRYKEEVKYVLIPGVF